MHLLKKHHWVYTTHCQNKTKLVVSNCFLCNEQQIFLIVSGIKRRGEEDMVQGKSGTRVAVQGGSTSNERGIAMGDASAS